MPRDWARNSRAKRMNNASNSGGTGGDNDECTTLALPAQTHQSMPVLSQPLSLPPLSSFIDASLPPVKDENLMPPVLPSLPILPSVPVLPSLPMLPSALPMPPSVPMPHMSYICGAMPSVPVSMPADETSMLPPRPRVRKRANIEYRQYHRGPAPSVDVPVMPTVPVPVSEEKYEMNYALVCFTLFQSVFLCM